MTNIGKTGDSVPDSGQLPLFGEQSSLDLPLLSKNNVTITGSRGIMREAAWPLFDRYLGALQGMGKTWFLGGARGLDLWATEWLLDHQETCYVVLPFAAADQPLEVQPILNQVKRVVELHLPKNKGGYIRRNKYMVDRSSIVFGFWQGNPGGTISTIQYAIRSFREVHVIPVAKPG